MPKEKKGNNGVKLAISGKGGVGKTTLAAFVIKEVSRRGMNVLAIDADPDANLALALGMPDYHSIVPIADMKELIEERTGVKMRSMGTFFKMNPTVSDLPERLSLTDGNIKLMVMGGVKKGGGGCVCPENVLLKSLVSHLVLNRDEAVVMDMEAGIEHLGRGTAGAVNCLIVVVEPGKRSVETALETNRLAGEIGLKNVVIVGNKIRNKSDKEYLKSSLPDFTFLGFIPYHHDFIEADINGRQPFESVKSPKVLTEVARIVNSVLA
jgi:CO dehydrogenase maturation factor